MHSLLLLALGFVAYPLASCVPSNAWLEERQSTPDYSYTGETGPTNWGNLSPAFALCETGNNQSPINLDGGISLARVSSVAYPNVPSATKRNTGKTIEIDASTFNPKGNLTFNGKLYLLDNIHVHTPSEHRLFNEHFPLEAHFVHKLITDPNDLLVVGIFFELINPGLLTGIISALEGLVDCFVRNIGQITQSGGSTSTGPLDLRPVADFIEDTPLYNYPGSLTTPPCSEGVTWLVANRAVGLGTSDYNAIKDIVKFNSRFTQNVPGRNNLLEVACA